MKCPEISGANSMRLLDNMFLMERHLQIPNGDDCSDCPFYVYDLEALTPTCNNGMLFSADVTGGKRNAECLEEFPSGAMIWFERGKQT